VIARRLAKAKEELEHYGEYEHLIVNDELERAYGLLRAIYLTRRYGKADRTDVSYPLADLARIVESNAGADAHARKLLGR
jgi:guanylate kinase